MSKKLTVEVTSQEAQKYRDAGFRVHYLVELPGTVVPAGAKPRKRSAPRKPSTRPTTTFWRTGRSDKHLTVGSQARRVLTQLDNIFRHAEKDHLPRSFLTSQVAARLVISEKEVIQQLNYLTKNHYLENDL